MGTIDTNYKHSGPTLSVPVETKTDYIRGWRFGVSKTVQLIELWLDRRRGRIALGRLSDAELRDIGISRAQADYEASRPFWDGSQKCR